MRQVPLIYLFYAVAAGVLLGLLVGGSGVGRGGAPVVAMESMDHGAHEHGTFEIIEGLAPSLSLSVAPDPESGWNLTVETENFTFRPPVPGAEISANAGHAHLYVNGEKRARLYGPLFHLTDLVPGENEVRVSLNTDDHQNLVYEGEMVEASLVVDRHDAM